jgi:hypothetical protein
MDKHLWAPYKLKAGRISGENPKQPNWFLSTEWRES